MSADYGIGAALTAGMHLVEQASRRTGRTTHMVASLKDGDRVVCHHAQEARRIERLAKDRGVTITTHICEPSEEGLLSTVPTTHGTTHFDHSWVESFYRREVAVTRNTLWRMQQAVNKDVIPPHFSHRFEGWDR